MKTKNIPPIKCTCWNDTNDRLLKKGFRLSTKLQLFCVTDDLALSTRYALPLERNDGKKLRRNDPGTITMSFCPFCGKQYPWVKK